MRSRVHSIFLATVLLDRNRWAPPPRVPAIRVSDWLPRIAEAGFDGIELWENHWYFADAAERTAIRMSNTPLRVFNSYLVPETASAGEIAELNDNLLNLGTTLAAVKFNLARTPGSIAGGASAALRLAAGLPDCIKLLCECHPGTIIESPTAAAEAFALWPTERFAAIVHPFFGDDATYGDWLRLLGPRLDHAHLQLMDGERRRLSLANHRVFAETRLGLLLASGFRGTFTLEFTAGVGEPEESPESLMKSAVADLALVRDVLGTGS